MSNSDHSDDDFDFHDEVEIEDFEFDEEKQMYFYPCPCGDLLVELFKKVQCFIKIHTKHVKKHCFVYSSMKLLT